MKLEVFLSFFLPIMLNYNLTQTVGSYLTHEFSSKFSLFDLTNAMSVNTFFNATFGQKLLFLIIILMISLPMLSIYMWSWDSKMMKNASICSVLTYYALVSFSLSYGFLYIINCRTPYYAE